MRITDKFVFFFGDADIYSNWRMGTPFKMNGVKFSCGEQAMMHEKARLMGDIAIIPKIMSATHPRDMKKFGRQVQNWDESLWRANRKNIMFQICFNRMDQNKDARAHLIATGNRTIVEASPYDKIWGIGLGEFSPGVEDPKNWKGLNLLGEAFMEVRESLIALYV